MSENHRVDLSEVPERRFKAQWFDPRSGNLFPADDGVVSGGRAVSFASPDDRCWVLWLGAIDEF